MSSGGFAPEFGGRPALASRLRGFGTSIFAEMTRLAQEHRAVNLAQGFPDFPGPDFAKRAAIEAIEADHNQYARMSGAPPLVEAIGQQFAERFGLQYDPMTEVTVTSGATEAIHCAFLAFCEPGDEVVLLEPYYDSYRACAAMAGAVPRFVTLRAPGFRWDPEQLRAAFTSRTRMVLLNTPHNPTGRVLDREELEQIASLCVEHDVICVTDEVYDRLVYAGSHVPIATLPGMRERTLTLNSTGKTFSLTGWKIGYALGPPALSAALQAVHQFVTFAVATPFQHAMARALAVGSDYFEQLQAEYLARRDRLSDGLKECGLSVHAPDGTYFVLADVRPLGYDNDVEFCRHLVERIGVAAVPASAFYENKAAGDFLVRFAFCKRAETLDEALLRLRSLRAR